MGLQNPVPHTPQKKKQSGKINKAVIRSHTIPYISIVSILYTWSISEPNSRTVRNKGIFQASNDQVNMIVCPVKEKLTEENPKSIDEKKP